MVLAIRTLIPLGSIMDKYLLSETRQMLHLHPFPVAVKRRVLPSALLTPRVLQTAFYLDMQAIPLHFDLQHVHLFDIQRYADLSLRHVLIPRLPLLLFPHSTPPISPPYPRTP